MIATSIQTALRAALFGMATQGLGCNNQVPERQQAVVVPSTITSATSSSVVPTVASGPQASSIEVRRTAVRLLEWKKQAPRPKANEDSFNTEAAGVMRPGHWDPATNVFSPSERTFVRALAMYAPDDNKPWIVVHGERQLGLTSLLSDV